MGLIGMGEDGGRVGVWVILGFRESHGYRAVNPYTPPDLYARLSNMTTDRTW